MTVKSDQHGDIRLLTFNHAKPTNPFSTEMMNDLITALDEAETDAGTRGIVLYGGEGRSFSAGGDFSEVIRLGGEKEISDLLNLVIDLYAAVLKVTKPVVAAVDNYAIGMGFQIALLCDYRVATKGARFIMPELKNGIACTLGGILLEVMTGRKRMMDICYSCDPLPIKKVRKWGIVNEIVKENPVPRALEMAGYYAGFPNEAFRNTKYVNNLRFLQAMENVRELTVEAHFKTLSSRKHVAYMESVLKGKESTSKDN